MILNRALPKTPSILGSEMGGILLGGRVSVRHWRSNPSGKPFKFLEPKVDVKKLRIDQPVSGSIDYGDMSKAREFSWNTQALNARGFLRYQKAYVPEADVRSTILALSKSTLPELSSVKNEKEILSYELWDAESKFKFLSAASVKTQHSVPNSMLYMMQSVGDVVEFYETEISTNTPFDNLVKSQDDLPPNLCVQKEPIRFHPETDTLFGGMTAFPKSSTLVTGLRSKKKYKGYEAKKSWP